MRNVSQLVSWKRDDREIAVMLRQGCGTKAIAQTLEKSVTTVNRHIRRMCRQAGVENRTQLVIWILQNPECEVAGAACKPGLHEQPCGCGSGYCEARMMAAAKRA